MCCGTGLHPSTSCLLSYGGQGGVAAMPSSFGGKDTIDILTAPYLTSVSLNMSQRQKVNDREKDKHRGRDRTRNSDKQTQRQIPRIVTCKRGKYENEKASQRKRRFYASCLVKLFFHIIGFSDINVFPAPLSFSASPQPAVRVPKKPPRPSLCEASQRGLEKDQDPCPEHHLSLNFYCTTCREVVCRDCTVVAHPQELHKILDTADAIATLRTSAVTLLRHYTLVRSFHSSLAAALEMYIVNNPTMVRRLLAVRFG
ncbi:uncharacterized protein LOC122244403 [Penaeus japonicus]|uniref:uncharacterized protein LOC122244403 n=1 Tax=Penaeus japonicus TaxID=27405 RepID=UPI001C715CDC|nr:uncharacterized protein LOC122244403 [Penaeus japonicus]